MEGRRRDWEGDMESLGGMMGLGGRGTYSTSRDGSSFLCAFGSLSGH